MIAAIIVAALILGGAMAYSAQNNIAKTTVVNATQAEAQNLKTITVNGDHSVFAAPDKVELFFSIETTSNNAQDAQQKNAQLEAAVKSAVKVAAGLQDRDIETVSYNVYPEYDWSSGIQSLKDYRATHQLKVELRTLSLAGKVIDAAVQAGANRVDSVQFGLTEATQKSLSEQELQLAAANARQKAEKIAAGLNAKIIGIKSASEGSSYTPPIYYARDMVATGGSSKAETTFSPGNVQVSAQVSVQFIIE